MKNLAIAIPTYNEKENLEDLVNANLQVVSKIPNLKTTIIIIDDNSPDGTGQIADQLAKKFNLGNFIVKVIHRTGKLGLGTAYVTAFKKAINEGNDYILSMDCDFSHKPEYIPDFLSKINNYSLVIGSRYIPGGKTEKWNLIRKILSRGGSLYTRIILGVNIKDFTGGYNMYTREILSSIDLDTISSQGYSFQIEMKYRCVKRGAKFIEIPIIFPDRQKGKAKMNKKIVFEALQKVWNIRKFK